MLEIKKRRYKTIYCVLFLLVRLNKYGITRLFFVCAKIFVRVLVFLSFFLIFQLQVEFMRIVRYDDEEGKCSGLALVRFVETVFANKALDAIPSCRVSQSCARRGQYRPCLPHRAPSFVLRQGVMHNVPHFLHEDRS